MNANIRLGKIWGIPIGLNNSWFIIFLILTWSLATGYFPGQYPQLGTLAYFGLGLMTSLLFFGSVLAHELGHAFMALRDRIPVRAITLFIFGGVAEIQSEPASPKSEFKIAIAGPAVSVGLAAGFWGLGSFAETLGPLAGPVLYLARINLILALFNLIPGFPLDGGRVLRALVWWITGDFQRSTRAASLSGQFVAFGFMGTGALSIFAGNVFNGLWLGFIGWFILNAATSAYAQVKMRHTLDQATVAQVMVPINTQVWVEPSTRLQHAMQMLETSNAAHAPVVVDGVVVGVISRDGVIRYLNTSDRQ